MSTSYEQATVGQLVAERPARARVFESLGIDYCCGGKRLLSEVCSEKGLALEAVLRALTEQDTAPSEDSTDWSKATLKELIEHIVSTYHVPLRQELPRLHQLANKVASVHGSRHPELKDVRDIFERFRAALESHMDKEEIVLFPMCVQLEQSKRAPIFHCGSIGNPIRMMTFEHDAAGSELSAMRKLTGNYTPPADGCNSYRALLDGLAELEATMHEHVHKENNILFPRAEAIEASLAGRP
jgi:regulator of cell morphogenesis and NO signaling